MVLITRNRCRELLATLAHLSASDDQAPANPIVVVDNGSDDGTPAAIRSAFPEVTVIEAGINLGAAGRTLGVEAARTPYVAFADDDSWWAPGALARAVALLDRHPRVALVAARILVGPEQRLDPVCPAMARSPLPAPAWLPGPSVLGFVACGAVVRRTAYLSVGGPHPRYGVGGEEALLALDLAQAGWWLTYDREVVAHHHPSPAREPGARQIRQVRNDLWTSWLRLPASVALADLTRVAAHSMRSPAHRRGLGTALWTGAWVLPARRVVTPTLAAEYRLLRRAQPMAAPPAPGRDAQEPAGGTGS